MSGTEDEERNLGADTDDDDDDDDDDDEFCFTLFSQCIFSP